MILSFPTWPTKISQAVICTFLCLVNQNWRSLNHEQNWLFSSFERKMHFKMKLWIMKSKIFTLKLIFKMLFPNSIRRNRGKNTESENYNWTNNLPTFRFRNWGSLQYWFDYDFINVIEIYHQCLWYKVNQFLFSISMEIELLVHFCFTKPIS